MKLLFSGSKILLQIVLIVFITFLSLTNCPVKKKSNIPLIPFSTPTPPPTPPDRTTGTKTSCNSVSELPKYTANPVPVDIAILLEPPTIYFIINGVKIRMIGISYCGLEYDKPYTNSQGNTSGVITYPGTAGINYQVPTASVFASIKSKGYTAVRLPFDLGRLVQNVGSYSCVELTFNAEYLGYINSAIQSAKDNDLFVVLDLHNAVEYPVNKDTTIKINNNTTYQLFLTQVWRQLSRLYSTNSTVIGYQIVNEPNPYAGESNWYTIAQQIVTEIRKIDSQKVLFINGKDFSGSAQWTQMNSTPFISDPANRTVYALHTYLDENSDGLYNKTGTLNNGEENPPADYRERVRTKIESAINWAKTNNVAISFTEFGLPRNNSNWNASLNYLLQQYFRQNNISFFYWTKGNASDQITSLVDNNYVDTALTAFNQESITNTTNRHWVFNDYIYPILFLWNNIAAFNPVTTISTNSTNKYSGAFALYFQLNGTYSQNGVVLQRTSALNTNSFANLILYYKSDRSVKVFTKNQFGIESNVNYTLLPAAAYTKVTIPKAQIIDNGSSIIELGFSGVMENVTTNLYLDELYFE